MFCPRCGRDCGGISFCPKCKRKFCPNCGNNCADAKFCPNCGLDLGGNAVQNATANQEPAFVPEMEEFPDGGAAPAAAAGKASAISPNNQTAAQKMLKSAHEARKYESQKNYVPAQNLTLTRYGDVPLTKKEKRKQKKAELEASGQVYCPKCLSVSVTANKKGFGIGKAVVGAAVFGGIGLAAGGLGAKKVICTCMKCGYQWQAGKK